MNGILKSVLIGVTAAAITTSLPGIASQVVGLVTFNSGAPAKASEVNGNFAAVKSAVDDNQAQITALNARIALLESKLTNVTALNDYLSLQTVNGNPTIRVTGANLQIVNGMDKTDTINGLGNLIIGYDESRPTSYPESCSISTGISYLNQGACASVGGVWAVNHKSGSHNLVLGSINNYSSYGGVVFGTRNDVVGAYAVVSGGLGNAALGEESAVNGGLGNTASGNYAAVAGGTSNTAAGSQSAVSGGNFNKATGFAAAVSGGDSNTASGSYSAISGGRLRNASAEAQWLGGN